MCVRVVAFPFGFTASENMFDLLQVTPEVKDAPNAEDLKLSTGTGGLVAPFWLLVLVWTWVWFWYCFLVFVLRVVARRRLDS